MGRIKQRAVRKCPLTLTNQKKTKNVAERKRYVSAANVKVKIATLPSAAPRPPPHVDCGDDKEEKFDIPKAAFARVGKEVAALQKPGLRFQKGSLDALQAATEGFVESAFSDAGLCASHRGRKTVTKKDLELIAKIKGF